MLDALIEYAPLLSKGIWLTILVGVFSLCLATLLGLLGAWGKLSKNHVARRAATLYTTLIRGVPDIVLMLLIFFGGQQLVNLIADWAGWGYIEINALVAGTLTIGFIFGAYMTETFRGAALAIPKGQIEAGIACGMDKRTLFRRILWPQLVRYALPSFGNNWLVMIKTTALVSLIGLQDVVYLANAAGKATRQPFTFTLALMVIFLGLTTLSIWWLSWMEKRYNMGVKKA